jgi:hypothetical protein
VVELFAVVKKSVVNGLTEVWPVNVQITQGSNYHTTEINVLHNGTTAYITEYGTIFSGSSLATFDATISSGNLLLQVTMGSNTSATIKVISTAIPV